MWLMLGFGSNLVTFFTGAATVLGAVKLLAETCEAWRKLRETDKD